MVQLYCVLCRLTRRRQFVGVTNVDDVTFTAGLERRVRDHVASSTNVH